MVARLPVPISMGSSGAQTLAAGGFVVNDMRFPAHARLTPHIHEHASLAVMLQGSFDLGITGRSFACEPGSSVVEPPVERHSNGLGNAGARVLAVQPDPAALDRLGPCGELFDAVRFAARSPVRGLAWRIACELACRDVVTSLAVEALVLEMVALALRSDRTERKARAAPRWLLVARDWLHDQYLDPPGLDDLAATAGVHPDYLARTFRVWFGVSIGGYVRGLRLDWAAVELAGSATPIVEIALRAGFADQSHFTRLFKHRTGLTPGTYRRVVE